MRTTRSTGAVSGLLVAVLGIWGALIPFVGPYFDYSFGANTTWHYTTDRLWLNILPGAVALIAGVLLVLAATRAVRGFGAWLALLAGAWFVLGPAISLTWEHGPGPIGPPLYGSTRQMLELVGYFYGLGALIVALAAFTAGRLVSRPQPSAEETLATAAPPATTPTEPVGGQPRATATGGALGKRRLPFPRRRGRPAHPPHAENPMQR